MTALIPELLLCLRPLLSHSPEIQVLSAPLFCSWEGSAPEKSRDLVKASCKLGGGGARLLRWVGPSTHPPTPGLRVCAPRGLSLCPVLSVLLSLSHLHLHLYGALSCRLFPAARYISASVSPGSYLLHRIFLPLRFLLSHSAFLFIPSSSFFLPFSSLPLSLSLSFSISLNFSVSLSSVFCLPPPLPLLSISVSFTPSVSLFSSPS